MSAAGILSPVVAASRTSAQDDWGLERGGRPAAQGRTGGSARTRRRSIPTEQTGPRPATDAPVDEAAARYTLLATRYRTLLEARIDDRGLADRWIAAVRGRDGSLDLVFAELQPAAGEASFVRAMLLGYVCRGRLDWAAASVAFQRASALDDGAVAPHLALAEVAKSTGRPTEIQHELQLALALARERSLRSEILRELGEVELKLGLFAEAESRFAELARADRTSSYVRTEFARALSQHGEHARAVAEYERILASLRGDPRATLRVLRGLGESRLALNDFAGAIAAFDRALSSSSSDSGYQSELEALRLQAYRRADRLVDLVQVLERGGGDKLVLARLYDELGRSAQSLATYRRVVAARPRDIDPRIELIRLLTRDGELDLAIGEYKKLVALAPREPRHLTELCEMLVQLGRKAEAMAILSGKLAGAMGNDVGTLRVAVELYEKWGEHDKSQALIARLARIAPDDPAYLEALGESYFVRDKRVEAIAAWRRAAAQEGNEADAHARLAAIFSDHDLLAEARTEYEAAIAAVPSSVDYARGLAGVLDRLGDAALAETAWKRVIALSGDPSVAREARQHIVATWARTGIYGRRVAELEAALIRDPHDLAAARFLAEAYRRQIVQPSAGAARGAAAPSEAARANRAAKAERALRIIVSEAPTDQEAWLALAQLYEEANNLRAAIDALSHLAEADARRAPAYFARMAEHAQTLYLDDEALRYARRAVELAPDDALARTRLGRLLANRQDVAGATASYESALRLDAEAFDVWLALGELLRAQGQNDRAFDAWMRVLNQSRDDEQVDRAGGSLLVLVMATGEQQKLEGPLLTRTLLEPTRANFRRLLLRLYQSWLPALEGEELARVVRRAAKPLLFALSDTAAGQREVALLAFGRAPVAAANSALLALAESSTDYAARSAALLALAAPLSPALAQRVVALAEGPEQRLRFVASFAYARAERARALPVLARWASHAEPLVRAYALMARSVLRDPSSVAAARAAVLADSSPVVVAAAISALHVAGEDAAGILGTTGAPDAPARREPHRAGDSLRVRLVAAFGVARIARLFANATSSTDAGAQIVADALFDPDVQLRTAAWRALSLAQEPRLWTAEALFGESSPNVEGLLLEPFAASGAEGALDALTSPRWQRAVSDALARALGRARFAEISVFVERFERSSAADQALRNLLTPVMPAVLASLDARDPAIRRFLPMLLGLCVRAEVRPTTEVLLHLLAAEEAPVRETALGMLALGADDNLLDALAQRLSDEPVWWLRAKIADRLGASFTPPAAATVGTVRDALVRCVKEDTYSWVRHACAQALEADVSFPRDALSNLVEADPEPLVADVMQK